MTGPDTKYQFVVAERALERALEGIDDDKLREKIECVLTALADAWSYL